MSVYVELPFYNISNYSKLKAQRNNGSRHSSVTSMGSKTQKQYAFYIYMYLSFVFKAQCISTLFLFTRTGDKYFVCICGGVNARLHTLVVHSAEMYAYHRTQNALANKQFLANCRLPF